MLNEQMRGEAYELRARRVEVQEQIVGLMRTRDALWHAEMEITLYHLPVEQRTPLHELEAEWVQPTHGLL